MFSGAKNSGIGTVPANVPKKRWVCAWSWRSAPNTCCISAEGGSSRADLVGKMLADLGGSLEAYYFAFGEEAAAAGRDYLRHYYAFTGPFAERIAAGLLTTPQAVSSFVRGYAEAGCDELVLFPTTSDISQLEQLSGISDFGF